MIKRIIDYVKAGQFGGGVVFEKTIEPKLADTASLDIIESQIIRDAIEDMGIENLYSHQAESYQKIRNGEDVLITTPTASGKSLCYNLPIIEEMYHNRNINALYFFPLKALGHDQKRALDEFLSNIPLGAGIGVEVIDGDTDKQLRRKILNNPPNIIITNPDILHYSILSGPKGWESFLKNIKYIVVDELHVYRGVFGSHVYNLFTRFLRLFPHIQIISCSATVNEPEIFAKSLFSRKFSLINRSGAPTGKKHFVMFNPDISVSAVAGYFLKVNIESGVKTICFTKSRNQTESIYARLLKSDKSMGRCVTSYRAGFLPHERREIEQKFSSGELKAVVSTSAFELGIDIGGVDSTILTGYPGSMMSLWQRAGRSGRKGDDSLVVMIAGNDALDQYYVRNPELLFSGTFERVTVDRKNKEINEKHIMCAALEKPLSRDENYFKDNVKLVYEMVSAGKLFEDIETGEYLTLDKFPYKNVDLRMAGDSYTMHCGQVIIATNSGRRVYMENFIGAVYLHRGNNFIVKKVDKSKREIHLDTFNGNYFTMPMTDKQTEIIENIEEFVDRGINSSFCGLKVTETLTGYSKMSSITGEKIQDIDLDSDPIQFTTKGFCLVIPTVLRKETEDRGHSFMGSIHALEHAMIAMIPTFILCSRDDIGGISYPMHPQLKQSAIFVYDGYAGGIGITERIAPEMRKLLMRTFEAVSGCECESGCPACIYSPKCGSGNYPLDKHGTIFLMKKILEAEKFEKIEITEIIETKSIKKHDFPENDTLYFDLETKYSADEVGGWSNIPKMGMSIGVVFSEILNDYEVYDEEHVYELIERLENAGKVIGFNHIGFDYKVLSGYRKPDMSNAVDVDMLLDVQRTTGRRFSLENLAVPTLKVGKSADGLQALAWYKEGRIDLIAEYCKKDVEVTKDLYLFGKENGYILGRMKTGNIIKIPTTFA